MHGLELQIEAVRQPPRPVDQPRCSALESALVISGPMVTPVSQHAARHRGTRCERAPRFVPPRRGMPRPVPEADQLDAPLLGKATRARRTARASAAGACPRISVGGRSGSATAASPFDLDWVAVGPRAAASIRGSGAVATRCIRRCGITVRTSSCWSSLPEAGRVRMIGNLTGDPMQEGHDRRVGRGGVRAPTTTPRPPFTLVQWENGSASRSPVRRARRACERSAP